MKDGYMKDIVVMGLMKLIENQAGELAMSPNELLHRLYCEYNGLAMSGDHRLSLVDVENSIQAQNPYTGDDWQEMAMKHYKEHGSMEPSKEVVTIDTDSVHVKVDPKCGNPDVSATVDESAASLVMRSIMPKYMTDVRAWTFESMMNETEYACVYHNHIEFKSKDDAMSEVFTLDLGNPDSVKWVYKRDETGVYKYLKFDSSVLQMFND